MRIGIAGFLHESNTFLPAPTTLEDFQSTSWTEGAALLERWSGALHELGGLVDGCAEHGLTAVPLLATYAVPSGTIAASAYDAIVDRLTSLLRDALPLDGVLLALHGATVAENFPDADGEITRRVREIAGPRIPVILTLDLHANVSQQMIANTDAAVFYRSNPHLDQRQRGLEAARLMARTVRGEIRPVQALETPPWIIPIDRQYTNEHPARLLYQDADLALSRPGVLSTSVAMGFYYADVAEMGASFLAVTDGDPTLARDTARWMARRAWERRHDFQIQLIPPAEAVREAAAATRTPVALFDVGDNVGGGSSANSTVLLEEILRQGVPNCAIVLYDHAAVTACLAAGVRNEVRLNIGGGAVPITGRVRTLSDGLFVEHEVRHGGWGRNDQGITAVVEAAGETTIVLTSRRMAPMSLQQLVSLGIPVERKRAIVVKGVVAPRAAYAPVCPQIILVDTPGETAGNPAHFTYRRRRIPMFPLEPEAEY
jgi:microcystin degradation protein MlrC